MDNIKVGTFNIRGLKNLKKRRIFFTYLKAKSFDIICLQETHATKNEEYFWQTHFGGKILYSNGTPRSCGVAILISNRCNIKIGNVESDKEDSY